MKLRTAFLFVIFCFTKFLAGQHSVTTIKSENLIEYETTGNCNDGYHRELYHIFRLDGLDEDELYTLSVSHPSLLDNLDNISLSSDSYDWEIYDNTNVYSQEWIWRGEDNGTDYISIDVSISDHDDVEIDLSQTFSFSLGHLDQNGNNIITRTSEVKVYTPTYIGGDFLDCSNPITFDLEDLSSYGTSSWVIKQFGSTKASGSGTAASASNITTGSGEVIYTVSFSCGLDPLTFTKEFWFGKFENTVVTGTGGVCPSSLYMYTAQVPGGHQSSYSYTWTYPSNWSKYSQYNNFVHLYTPSSPNYGTVRVSITNSCGTSGYSGITVYPGYCGGYYMMMPNPSSTYIDLDVDSQKTTASEVITGNDITISIVDKMGTPIFSQNVTSLPYRIDTGKFKKGEYIATILTRSKAGYVKDQRVESIMFIVE